MSTGEIGRDATAWPGAVVDQGQDALAVFDEQGTIVYVNDAALRYLRYRREDIQRLRATADLDGSIVVT